MLTICLLLAAGFAVWITRLRIGMDRAAEARILSDVVKELGSWDRVKELGFNDVIEWESAFEKATGALPERSRTKELESIRNAKIEQEMKYMSMYANTRIGAPIPMRTGEYNQRARVRILDNAESGMGYSSW